jgi:hypothetical protein
MFLNACMLYGRIICETSYKPTQKNNTAYLGTKIFVYQTFYFSEWLISTI